MNTVEAIIKKLELQPHPEGGYFKETYRSEGNIAPANLGNEYNSSRNYATSIYFLLTSDSFSAFHKIHQDEQWHFYEGSGIELHIISPGGDYSVIPIGNDIFNGQTLQYTVPGGHWFAAEVPDKDTFALVGCTVSPGFDFVDFTLPTRAALISEFPQHKAIITHLTHS